MGMSTHEREKPAILAPKRVKELPDFEEVMIDEANDMKSIRYDFSLRKIFTNQIAVGF